MQGQILQRNMYRENVKKNIVLKSLLARKAETSVKASSGGFKIFFIIFIPMNRVRPQWKGSTFYMEIYREKCCQNHDLHG